MDTLLERIARQGNQLKDVYFWIYSGNKEADKHEFDMLNSNHTNQPPPSVVISQYDAVPC